MDGGRDADAEQGLLSRDSALNIQDYRGIPGVWYELPHIGALLIRTGFWGPLCCNYIKEPPK